MFYGIAAATNGLVPATEGQVASLAALCAAVARFEGWSPALVGRHLEGHDAQAIWTASSTLDRTRWGKLGRKIDPTGNRADGRPLVDLVDIRHRVRTLLGVA